jgi:hypothetical protein
MKTIYRSEKGKKEILDLYDAQLVMGAERDCLFPGAGVIERAEKIIPNCKTYLLRGRGHMHFLTDEEKKMIVDFLLE